MICQDIVAAAINLPTHPPFTSHCDSDRVAEFFAQSDCDGTIVALQNKKFFVGDCVVLHAPVLFW